MGRKPHQHLVRLALVRGRVQREQGQLVGSSSLCAYQILAMSCGYAVL